MISRSHKSFLQGRFVSEGIRMTIGIIVPALLMSTMGMISTGIVMSVGALCVSSTDAAGPVHHRRNAMLICNVCIFFVALITAGLASYPFLLGLLLILFSFLFSMIAVYGPRVASLGIACLLIMILNMDHPLHGHALLLNSLYILSGGLWYMCFSLLINRLWPYKLIQQVLGDLIESTAEYLMVRATLYNKGADYEAIYLQLMQKQAAVQEKQSMISELLFKTRTLLKETTNTGRVLVMIFLDVTDLFERLMTSYQQYESLHKYFDDYHILIDLQDLLRRLSDELKEIGFAVKSGRTSTIKQDTLNSLNNTTVLFEEFRLSGMNTSNVDGFLALGRIFESIRDLGDRIKVLHHYTSYDRKLIKKSEKINYEDFIVRQEIRPSLFYDSISLSSNIFRHSIRLSLAVIIGYLISLQFHIGHGYWILLTIVVILKPAYTLTKTRNKDRILGTAIGIIIGTLILYFIKNNYFLLTVMIIFMTISYIFLRKNYFLSVLLMTPYLLIFFHLIQPLEFRQVLLDRLIDTAIGSLIAFLANIFIVPAWEYTSITTYMSRMLQSNVMYFKKVASVFTEEIPIIPEGYKEARKEVQISLANLSDAFTRMISEPKKYQHNADLIHRFVVLNHTLTSHIATLAYYLNASKKVYTSIKIKPVMNESISMLLDAEENLSKSERKSEKIYLKDSLHQMNSEAEFLLQKRKEEIHEGNYETDTKISLIRIKPITDQFNFIYSIAADILKLTKQIYSTT